MPQHAASPVRASFLLFVMVLAALAFSFVPPSVPFGGKLLARFMILPLVAGAAYEILRLSAQRRGQPLPRGRRGAGTLDAAPHHQ